MVRVSETRRAEIRRFYRMARLAVDKTQLQVETLARLDAGKFWKIENGVVFPSQEERSRISKVLKINEADIPSEHVEARAS